MILLSKNLITEVLDAFDYFTSTVTENLPTYIETAPVEPVLARLPAVVKECSVQGQIELAGYEGLANTKYIDSGGVHTIGIGMTVSEIRDLVRWGWDKTISTEDCVYMFDHACKKYEEALNNALKVKVAQYEFDALLSITYNIGIAGMRSSTFMRRLNANDSHARVVEAMGWYNKDNGKVVKGLINRRRAEANIFLGKGYTNDGTVAHIAVSPSTHKPSYKNRISIKEYFK